MEPLEIIKKYYAPGSKSYLILVEHSRAVAKKAVETAKKLEQGRVDLQFIEQAALLHDIGVFLTSAVDIGCFGERPYVCHGYLGREILEKHGLPEHALVCERHVGVGITKKDIEKYNLPLPKRDMIPISLEEQIICFADKFFSKNKLGREKSVDEIRENLAKFGKEKIEKFNQWLKLFVYEK